MIFPVILASGSGSRLWPLPRQLNPKQFLPLTGESTMLQATVARLHGLDVESPVVMCNNEHRFLVAEQLRACGVENAQVLLEPVGRNTAPAIALAAMSVLKIDPEAVLLVLAADHVVKDESAFQASVTTALTFAEQGKLVTFGVTPTGPETGYGYIRAGCEIGKGVAELEEFVEKPSVDMAQVYIDAGGYTWNSGMLSYG